MAVHHAWMVHAYAIGLAGTQVFTEPRGAVLFADGLVAADLGEGAGWVVDLRAPSGCFDVRR